MLKISESNSILKISLNRPDVRNAMNPDMIAQLTETFKSLETRKDLRGVVLSGEGKVFCAGADLQTMQSMVNFTFEENKLDASRLHDMFEVIRLCPVPVISLVQGAAFGGALGLIAASDIVIAEDRAQFCFSEVKLGIAPAVISRFVLKKCNLGAVAPWMMTAKVFTTAEAVQMGLVHHIVPAGNLIQAEQEWMSQLNEAGPEAVRFTKKLLIEVSESLVETKDQTTRAIAERRVSAEGQEGLKSFLQKRSPSWKQ